VGKLSDALNERGKPVRGARVLVLGVAYKRDVDDMRESPAVELMSLLMERGARVDYSDPHVPVFPRMRKYAFEAESVALSPEVLAGYDVVLIATDHDAFDYDMVLQHAKLVVDTRGRYDEPAPNLVRA
jgi:UDP-N-acetyl-D-glucosamine dehydrogenase